LLDTSLVVVDIIILSVEILAILSGGGGGGSSTKAGVKLGRLARFTKGLRGMRMLRSGVRGARLVRECRTSTLKLLDKWRRYMRPTKRGVMGSLRESLRALDEVDSWAGRVPDLGQNIKRELDRSTSMVISEVNSVRNAATSSLATSGGGAVHSAATALPGTFNTDLATDLSARLERTEKVLSSMHAAVEKQARFTKQVATETAEVKKAIENLSKTMKSQSQSFRRGTDETPIGTHI
jgi:hypothetical protein